MSRRLAATVALLDEAGTVTVWPAGSTPPKDAAARITNEAAWVDTDETVGVTPPPPEPPAPQDPPPPPATGGSTISTSPAGNAATDVWMTYARGLGVTDLPEDSGREQIKAALEQRGLLEV